jgi:hypothetical protein
MYMRCCCWQDVAGVLLVADASTEQRGAAADEQERELESLYMGLAQPNALPIKCCCVLGVALARTGSSEAGQWDGVILRLQQSA